MIELLNKVKNIISNLNSRQLGILGGMGFLVLLLIISLIRSEPVEEEKQTSPFTKERDGSTSKPTPAGTQIEDRGLNEDAPISPFGGMATSEDVFIPSKKPSKDTAIKTRVVLASKLPIILRDFKTSVGIVTTTAIFTFDHDEANVVHVETVGLDFRNLDNNPATNPNVTAFRETFLASLEKIREAGVDPGNLHYTFGTRDFQHITAQRWVTQMNLL